MTRGRRSLQRYIMAALAAICTTALLLMLTSALFSRQSTLAATLSSSQYWETMQGVCAWAATSSLIGSAFLALVQYLSSWQERHLGIYNHIFERLMSDEHVKARRWVYQNVQLRAEWTRTDYEALMDALERDAEAHANVKLCLNALDHLGFLVARGWMDDEPTIGWLKPIVLKTWERLESLIAYERTRRGDPDYYLHVDVIAKRCAAHLPSSKRKTAERVAGPICPTHEWLERTL